MISFNLVDVIVCVLLVMAGVATALIVKRYEAVVDALTEKALKKRIDLDYIERDDVLLELESLAGHYILLTECTNDETTASIYKDFVAELHERIEYINEINVTKKEYDINGK